jgi:threonine dehydrogenase-like Zn-dependent dehydrogenase
MNVTTAIPTTGTGAARSPHPTRPEGVVHVVGGGPVGLFLTPSSARARWLLGVPNRRGVVAQAM